MAASRTTGQGQKGRPAPDQELADILHSLRNPMAAVQMAVSMASEFPDGTRLSEVRDHLSIASMAAARVIELIGEAEQTLDDRGRSDTR